MEIPYLDRVLCRLDGLMTKNHLAIGTDRMKAQLPDRPPRQAAVPMCIRRRKEI